MIRIRISHVLATSIVLAWVVSALQLGQPILAGQKSSALLALGAADSSVWRSHQWWRLLSSQWLHVKFLHMLFNALGVLVAGVYVERRTHWAFAAAVYLVGGVLGQIASVYLDPSQVASGASQAMLALCATAMALSARREGRDAYGWAVLIIIMAQLGLDLKAAHTVKIGHTVGLVLGLAAGFAAMSLGLLRAAKARVDTAIPAAPWGEKAAERP